MTSNSGADHSYNVDYYSQPRKGFLTPPPSWRTRRCSPAEKKPRKSPPPPSKSDDLFHVIHKVPSGDSPYVRAKHVQLIDKDPSRAISLFWAAINSGDRVDSALKDMAVVMKQLDRSDEAIEAIKSFRHLCPPESQESIDNILVELYKQSGRTEEEIEMLQLKLKQVEEGMAFGGKRTKMARSQGKKVHITVEKEYSRLLGNLAWAYMQHKDYKSAEEHYRKALSFESDKNKQCNLAICLMHLNKLTEARFLLQAIKVSYENGQIDESHVKSYERASQMLVEFESQSQRVLDGGYCDATSPLPLSVNKMNNKAFTEFPYEKRADYDWRRNNNQLNAGQEYSSRKRANESPFCNRAIPRVPFTQPRRGLWSDDKSKGSLTETSCRKLSFGSFTSSENAQLLVNQNVNQCATKVLQFSEKQFPCNGGDWRKNAFDNLDRNHGTVKPSETNEERKTNETSDRSSDVLKDLEKLNLPSGWTKTCERRKSWADMVEEEEKMSGKWTSDDPSLSSFGSPVQETFNDENMDSNIIPESPNLLNQAEKLSEDFASIDLGVGYFTQPGKSTVSTNQSVRRSLCFDQNNRPQVASSSPLAMKALNFEGQALALSEDFSSTKAIKRRNRLPVFQDITTLKD